jgi:hypothetical protein
MWHSARKRAARKGVPFTITQEDVRQAWPSGGVCPVLGLVLRVGAGHSHDASPTLDRINPGWGYEPGNLAIISHRANRAKNSLSAREHELIARWMREQGLN